jgi:hypothetical protein
MSSFFAHGLAGLTTYAIGYKLQTDRISRFDRYNCLWLGFLVAISLIPDIDYLVPQLKWQEGTEILFIESGVLIPLSISLFLSVGDSGRRGKHQLMIGMGLLISGYFMI